jgi:flagellar protein FliO/FliZ
LDTVFLALRVIVSLAVVLGVLFYLQKKLSKRGVGKAAGKAVTLIGRQAVGPKASVAIVEVDGRRLVLGVTEHSVTVLHNSEPIGVHQHSAERGRHPFEVSFAEAQNPISNVRPITSPIPVSNHRPITAPVPIRAVITTPADQELRRPRKQHRQHSASRLSGSILSPETWRQASAAIREVR